MKLSHFIQKSLLLPALLVAGLAAITPSLSAAYVNATATWSGSSYGNTASASATFKLDTDYLSSNEFSMLMPDGVQWITDIDMTVLGSASGNGNFTSADFDQAYFNHFGTVDFSQDLVGQANFVDFNLFSMSGAPTGVEPNLMVTRGFEEGISGESLVLTSLTTSAVPEPSALALLGLGTVGFIARRRRN